MSTSETIVHVCSKCGEPLVCIVLGTDEPQVCHRRHVGDPPDWQPKPLTLSERLTFYKEQKRGKMHR